MPLDDAAKEKWKRVRARLKAVAGEEVFSSWLAALQLEEIRETLFYCSVPTSFLKHWIEKNYAKNVLDCITQEWPEATKVYVWQRFAGQPFIIPEPKKVPEEDILIGVPKKTPMELRAPDATCPKDDSVIGEANSQSSSAEGDDDPEDHSDVVQESLDPNRRIFLKEIIKHACRHFKLARKLMLSEKRGRDVVRPRQVSMFLSKHMTKRSLPEIGRQFGGRDHTTVLHSVRKIEEEVRDNIEFAFEVASIEAAIRQMQLA